MQVQAKLQNLRLSPRKVRLVADNIRGLKVSSALNRLVFMEKRAALPMLKLLKSAVANAEHNLKWKTDNLKIAAIKVDGGTTLKRSMPRAMGRASKINKRTSHISIMLDEIVKSKIVDTKTKEENKDKKPAAATVVKSLAEVKTMAKADNLEEEKTNTTNEEHKPEIKDPRMEGSDRNKQHLDQLRKKGPGGKVRRIFSRKAV